MSLKAKEKKEWAKLMYLRTNKNQKEIADTVNVAEKTLSKWKTSENWDRLRSSIIITKDEQLRRVYQQINELTSMIEKRPEGERFADSSEADTLSKLASTSRSLESDLSIADIIDVFMGFTDWLREVDFKKAQEINELQDGYIKHRLNG
jgi:hypothetical protein